MTESRRFNVTALSGLVAGVAANAVLFAFRTTGGERSTTPTRIRVEGNVVSGFTATQEVALGLHWVTSFAGNNYTGGTDLSDPAAPLYMPTDFLLGSSQAAILSQSLPDSGNIRMADAVALAHAGAPTIKAQPFEYSSTTELATSSTTSKGFFQLDYQPKNPQRLFNGTGFVLRCPIALGAGGTLRVFVRCEWVEQGVWSS